MLLVASEIAYLAAWLTACVIAVGVMFARRGRLTLFTAAYRSYLLQGWKVATFTVAAVGMVVIAPYTGDPTWDYVDAAFMALLTFATAPWAVGTLYLGLRRRAGAADLYVAACLWLFSASWSYDGYLVWRDGYYPVTWLPNLFASSVLYCCGGLMWNLDWRPGRGVIFGFMERAWPYVPEGPAFGRVFWYALPFMLLVGAMIGAFLV